MGEVKTVEPVKLFCGVIAADASLFARVEAQLSECFGAIDEVSEQVPFIFTDYYADEMGPSLLRKFVAFATLIDPGRLPRIKQTTNAWEHTMGVDRGGRLCRQVNFDPGYVTPSKVVLATTKNFAHRLYLGEGIYGEITLSFRRGSWVPMEWTYPDYRSPAYREFFDRLRVSLRQALPPTACS